jgi:hypothetical protein
MNTYLSAADKLHGYMMNRHWNGQAIVGPDPIGKIHWRVTRFVKSYFPGLFGEDRYIYLQGQAYWIMGNLALLDLTRQARYLDIVEQCADHIVQRQPPDGAWRHPPLRERQGFISTVEGVWGSLGLLAAFSRIGKKAYLDSALKWYDVQINHIGFQRVADGLAANYYTHSKSRVPNVTTMLLWLAAELWHATGDSQYLTHTQAMARFIQHSQLETGELPYAYESQPHFQCYQYNSFQFMDLAHYYELTRDQAIGHVLARMATYLASGVTARASCRYDCFKDNPETNYWTAAIAAALLRAHQLGWGQGRHDALSKQAYQRVLARQNADGGFGFSDRNYGFLSDRRSYPRQLAMIMYLLCCKAKALDTATPYTQAGS